MRDGASLNNFTAIAANHQTAGRGRLDRTWLDRPGTSLLFSLVLKPNIDLSSATLITPVLSLAVCDLLETLSIDSSIRWPNDVLVGDKKIAGILSEASFSNRLDFVVASCGLNVTQSADELAQIDRPATSIFAETGTKNVPKELFPALIANFGIRYDAFLKHGSPSFFEEWEKKMSLRGQDVLIDLGKRTIGGRIEGCNPDGSINLIEKNGTSHKIYSGEVVRLNKEHI